MRTFLSSISRYILSACIVCSTCISPHVNAEGNTKITSFVHALRTSLHKVYFDQRFTFYCGAYFDMDEKISLPKGFTIPEYYKMKAKHVEWDHVVPTERFGRNFKEWIDGSPKCVSTDGTPYYGKKCVLHVNKEYQYMQADMYNLAPSMGVVNAAKRDYEFTMFSKKYKNMFGSCDLVVKHKQVQPPQRARGPIARTFLYMDLVYPKFSMGEDERKFMIKWDEMYPVDKYECMRNTRIREIQGNTNPILRERCRNIATDEPPAKP